MAGDRSQPDLVPVGPGTGVDQIQIVSQMASAIALSKVKGITPYDGSSSVEQWLEDYECRGDMAGWTGPILTAQLGNYLTDGAFSWYRCLNKECRIKDLEWTSLKQRMIASFRPSHHEDRLMEELSRKQGPDEDLLIFFDKKKMAGLDLGLTEARIVRCIITKVKDRYKDILIDRSYNTFDQLRARLLNFRQREEDSTGKVGPDNQVHRPGPTEEGIGL